MRIQDRHKALIFITMPTRLSEVYTEREERVPIDLELWVVTESISHRAGTILAGLQQRVCA